jgi:hypothetical protein
MKIFFFRFVLLLLFVLLQLSFFDILFPWFRAPLFLLNAVVVWTLVRGFPGALFMTVPLTILFESASLGEVTWFSLYAVLFAYGTSFLSRRLLLEHQGIGLGLYALISYGGVLLYQSLFSLFMHDAGTSQAFWFATMPTFDSVLFSLFFSVPIFAVTYVEMKHFEGYLDLTRQRKFLNVR